MGWLHPKWQSNVFKIETILLFFLAAFCLLLKRKKRINKGCTTTTTIYCSDFWYRQPCKALSKALIRDLLKLDLPTALKGSFHLCFGKSKVEKIGRMCTSLRKKALLCMRSKFFFLIFCERL